MQDVTDAEVVEGVDPSTGEVVALTVPERPLAEFQGYAGAGTLVVTEAEAKLLAEVLPDEQHEILPTGELYVPQVQYRRLLNRVFRPGQWALVPAGPYVKQGKTICREYSLVIRGHFVAQAVGEQDYQETNDRMSWATAAEGVKSNALTRCCKDLGIAAECWDRRWCDAWIAKYAVKVWRTGQKSPQWRRKDAKPWYDEKGGKGEPEAEAVQQEFRPSGPPEYELSAPSRGRIMAAANETYHGKGIPSKRVMAHLEKVAQGLGAPKLIQLPEDRVDEMVDLIRNGSAPA